MGAEWERKSDEITMKGGERRRERGRARVEEEIRGE